MKFTDDTELSPTRRPWVFLFHSPSLFISLFQTPLTFSAPGYILISLKSAPVPHCLSRSFAVTSRSSSPSDMYENYRSAPTQDAVRTLRLSARHRFGSRASSLSTPIPADRSKNPHRSIRSQTATPSSNPSGHRSLGRHLSARLRSGSHSRSISTPS